ncbi:LOW QUALITY PROTEIN: alkaline-phosphatase-like protein [Jimgerdemannia flammicorona]|uniref:GPI ethanolamine phosphate transferase 2 n=1 Tax=Jimgerdemannia flammicorona TaxID=994334 RepID=A0A433B9M4_9FUNG|nr:LOW QUALITY PROTEIN: alkaline-phosphatase-like protein [Jimgerdemannia flammicorona]
MYALYPYYLIILFLAAVQLAGLASFASGFFPYKVYLQGFATLQTDIPPLPALSDPELDLRLEPQFDRLVFMLVDALRDDFVYGNESAMSFVQSKISQGKALAYTAIAEAPTVTLPRIKALTTGSVPSFLDAILNIAESDTTATLLNQDNWLAQMRRAHKTIHFFGDDTWIKLFPGLFGRMEGTTSSRTTPCTFPLKDTTEVDLNVTRNVLPELGKPDWDVLIFHYLGLDHIGHTGGPKSPLMKPKQKEMDDVARSIYESVAESDARRREQDPDTKGTLFVLCGDHGMNEVGYAQCVDHAAVILPYCFHGSAITEAHLAEKFHLLPHLPYVTLNRTRHDPTIDSHFGIQAFLFITPVQDTGNKVNDAADTGSLENEAQPNVELLDIPVRVIRQIDVVPTLALLLGVPIPKNSLGRVVLDMFINNKGQF